MLTWCILIQSQIKSTSKGTQQRIVNGKVNMLAKSKSQLSHIKVWIFRELARQELSVTYGYWRDFEVSGINAFLIVDRLFSVRPFCLCQ